MMQNYLSDYNWFTGYKSVIVSVSCGLILIKEKGRKADKANRKGKEGWRRNGGKEEREWKTKKRNNCECIAT